MKKIFVLSLSLALLMAAAVLACCSKQEESADAPEEAPAEATEETTADTAEDTTAETTEETSGIDYMVPGFSEHQTGLALDLYFTVGGKEVYENEDLGRAMEP